MGEIQPDELYNTPGVKEVFKELWAQSPFDAEGAGWLLRITAPLKYKLHGFKKGGSSHVNIGMPPHGVLAQLHTHPRTLDPRPSTSDSNGGKGDWGAAVKIGIPVYVVSIWAIWKIMPNANEPVIVQVAQDWL